MIDQFDKLKNNNRCSDSNTSFFIIKVQVSKLRYFYMESFGDVPLLSRIHPDIKEAQMKVVRHIQQAYSTPVQKVNY